MNIAYTNVEQDDGPGPCKSIEGYIVFCSGIHEEAQEDQIDDLFSEYGNVKSIQINLDRKTGYMKGYSLIEYANIEEAKSAIKHLNDTTFLERKIKVDFAFKKTPKK